MIDVTGFPDTSQLLLAADALITDYSSVMFDFSVTGKPMYFLVPDIEHYRGELRGFYFDLAAHAPGPVVRTQDELVEALRDRRPRRPSPRRTRSGEQKFNARDDGHAAERVVARILDQGYIDALTRRRRVRAAACCGRRAARCRRCRARRAARPR